MRNRGEGKGNQARRFKVDGVRCGGKDRRSRLEDKFALRHRRNRALVRRAGGVGVDVVVKLGQRS